MRRAHLDDAPQPLGVRLARDAEHPLAAREEDGQAEQRLVDIVLVDATLGEEFETQVAEPHSERQLLTRVEAKLRKVKRILSRAAVAERGGAPESSGYLVSRAKPTSSRWSATPLRHLRG